MFYVGQKVVCVRDTFSLEAYFYLKQLPSAAVTYTVRDIVLGTHGDGSCRPGLLLREIKNETGPFGTEHCFDPDRFRPLVERKTDISVFTALLNPARQDA